MNELLLFGVGMLSGAMLMHLYLTFVIHRFGWSWKVINGKITEDKVRGRTR